MLAPLWRKHQTASSKNHRDVFNTIRKTQAVFDSLHSSNGSSELSPQSSSASHFQLWGIQRPLRHLKCPGRQVLLEQWAGSSSDWSPQSSSPSHCHDSGIHCLFAHCHWCVSHSCVAGGKTAGSVDRYTQCYCIDSHDKLREQH